MAIFDYKAKDSQGRTVAGAVEAPIEDLAADILRERNLFVLSLHERRKKSFAQTYLGFLNRIPVREIVVFSRQLAVMISSNVPIVRALRTLIKQTSNVTFKVIISEIADEVDGGAKLSVTLARYPQVFDNFFIHMIRSGETTGKLDEVLNYLADQKEKDYDLFNKIRGAMIYPAFILSGLVIVGVLMMVYVIPKLTVILEESGTELPLSTKILIFTSNFLKHQWWILLLGIILIIFAYKIFIRFPFGRTQIDLLKLKLPIFGGIFQRIYLTRFSRSFSTLIASGVPITQSLEIVADIVGNSIYKDLTSKTIKEVEEGNSVASIFVKSKHIPVMLPQMMAVGEETGRLDHILGKLSDFYAKEVESSVANLVTLVEPLVMISLGVGVALLVAGILLPMYRLSAAI